MDNKKIAIEIHTAIEDNNIEEVVRLIDFDTERLNMMTPFGNWLHIAASEGKLEIVKKLVELGADVNMRGGTFNGGAINNAASEGHIEIVKYLLSCGAEMDVSEPERNPLFGAIHGGHVNIAKLLIESGIDTSIKYNGKYMTNMDALAFAIERGQKEIAVLLGAKP